MGNGCTRPIRLPQSPDILSSAQTYYFQEWLTFNVRDVFSTAELKNGVIAQYADVTEDDGSIVHVWREPVAAKYSKLPGIRSLRDFVFSKHLVTGEVVARTRPLCYTGSFNPASMHVLAGQNPTSNIIPQMYTKLNQKRDFSEFKRNHLKQMYRDFIPIERWLPFLRS